MAVALGGKFLKQLPRNGGGGGLSGLIAGGREEGGGGVIVPDLRVSVLYINFVSWLRFFSSVLVTDKQALYEHTDEYKWIMWKVYVWWTLNISKADALSLVVSLTNRQTLLLFPTQAKRNSSWCFCYITF